MALNYYMHVYNYNSIIMYQAGNAVIIASPCPLLHQVINT